ncbi:porin family protein [Pseudoflavitalea sp. G-6-1-2]|uniref:DUF6089 family protein n=1 Tax=Pseudoflavitalea sp. G-6-1-2 TaxID=2728841 RepID=UPI00146C1CDD|nr:DUF6089 family protein [Pseudoflavitalea sp. G-6-1-2]NML23758.1 porin family protein [Pseudoflavitalea sp. G-6-1-2]
MRKLLVWCLLLPAAGYSQSKFSLNLFGGFSSYQGDLQDKRFTLDQSNLAIGAGLQYDFTPNLAVRLGFVYGKLEADDKQNSGLRRLRNLNFQTSLFETHLLMQYTLFDLSEKRISPYVFGGAALFHFNPYTHDLNGNKYYLKPLSTEGQGIIAGRDEYSLTQFAIPFGVGVKFQVSEKVGLGFEVGLRKTFTDYIDDVSTTYVDQFQLAAAKGPMGTKAVELAYRGDELKEGNPVYPDAGTVRGGSKQKDWYYFTGLTLSIRLGSGNGGGSSYSGWNGRRSRLGCPPVRQ